MTAQPQYTKPVVCIRSSNHTFTPFTSDWLLPGRQVGGHFDTLVFGASTYTTHATSVVRAPRLSNTPQSATNHQVCTVYSGSLLGSEPRRSES